MRTGFVKWFDYSLGYGFLRFLDGSRTWREVFFHKSDLTFNVRDGDRVVFELRDSVKGPKAVHVRKGKNVIEVF